MYNANTMNMVVLFIINLIQFLFKVLLIGLPLLYVISFIYVPIKKGIKLSNYSHKQKLWLMSGPFIIVALALVFWLANPILAKSRYDAWAHRCGHEPIIGIHDTITIEEGKEAFAGFGTRENESAEATRYFCSFGDAQQAGYLPAGYIKDDISQKYK
jgi:hypothetical protein